MKKLLSIALLTTTLALVGCAGLDRNAYEGENLAADTISGGRHTFNVWLQQEEALAGTNETRIAQLTAARDYVHEQVYHAGVVLNTVDQLRLEYKANANSTNTSALKLIITSLPQVSSNLQATVTYFMKGGFVPAFKPIEPPLGP